MIKITLIGRPNTGKSTLFNRLCGYSRIKAQVSPTPGYTRDRKENYAYLWDLPVHLTDTAGLGDYSEKNPITKNMRHQTEKSIDTADLCLFLLDGIAGTMPYDRDCARFLHKKGVKVILIMNKCESKYLNKNACSDAYTLGFGKPFEISAKHGDGIAAIYHKVNELIDKKIILPSSETAFNKDPKLSPPLDIAIIGRPNAGKSSLVNALLGEERMITSPQPGTTRDASRVRLPIAGKNIYLYDTAGLRKKARIKDYDEKLMVKDALKSIRNSDVVALVMEHINAFEVQDMMLASKVKQQGKCLIFVISKWDEVKNSAQKEKIFTEKAMSALPDWHKTKVIFVSAHKNQGLQQITETAINLNDKWSNRFATAKLNDWLTEALNNHPPPMKAGRTMKIRYVTQVGTKPPLFNFFCSKAEAIAVPYRRYLHNNLRNSFQMYGVPLRLKFTSGHNPYVTK